MNMTAELFDDAQFIPDVQLLRLFTKNSFFRQIWLKTLKFSV